MNFQTCHLNDPLDPDAKPENLTFHDRDFIPAHLLEPAPSPAMTSKLTLCEIKQSKKVRAREVSRTIYPF